MRRSLVGLVSGALVVGSVGIAVAPAAVAAEAPPSISVEKLLTQQVDDPTADTSVLIGGSIGYTVRVANSGAAGVGRAYNVSVRDVLPAGVTYKAGTASLGEPTIVKDAPAVGQTTLVWTNLFDVTPAGVQEITYEVTPDPVLLPVGSTVTNSATAYATNDPFDVSDFTPTGTCSSACDFTASDSVDAVINAVIVRKNEVTSPENELVRGVHDNAAVYSITITNNTYKPTTAAFAIDYLPSGLEFLGCGGVDNTAADLREWTEVGGSGTEAPRLTVVPAPLSNCLKPLSVDTVSSDPPGPAPAGIYTRVLWSLGDLAVGQSRTINYRAGIPLFENTTTWPSGKPSTTSLLQAANLDNNTGPSTVETTVEKTWTNHVNAIGKYQGPDVNGNNPVSVNTFNRDTVTAEDLAIDKSVRPGVFSIGGTATYTLRVRTSEYRTATVDSLVDSLPDGLRFVPGSATASLRSPAGTSTVPVDVVATDYAAGPQELTITPTLPGGEVPTSATLTITFSASMEASYSSGAPTASGDSYRNEVALSGTTTPAVCPNVPPGPASAADCDAQPVIEGVKDSSAATIESGGPVIDKRIGQVVGETDCEVQIYADSVPALPFQIGDLICFELSGDQAPGAVNNVLSPIVRDFLPSNLAYEPGSATVVRGGPADTNLPDSAIRFSDVSAPVSGGGSLEWVLGEVDPQATNPGQLVATPQNGEAPRFRFRFAARVVSAILDQNKDIKGNLMKTSALDSAGQAVGGRDQVDFELAGSQVAMLKGVAQINGAPARSFPPNTDNKSVKGGDVVRFRIDITNTGLSAAGSNVPVRSVTVIDDLPPGITCADIDPVTDAASYSCVPGSPSRVTWERTAGTIDPGDSKTITYDMTIPSGVLVNTNYVNQATVTEYESFTNASGWVVNAPEGVTDPSNVRTPNASITKTGETELDLPNNNLPSQFTVGEEITYTVDAVVPAGTSLPAGSRLSDAIPAGLRNVAGTGEATFSEEGTSGPFVGLPDEAVFRDGGTDWITFPTGFSNTSLTKAAVFRLQFTAIVLGGTYAHGQQITNTARFRGSSFDRSASYSARVVLPNPQIAKANSAAGAVDPGDEVTFTLRVTNPSPSAPSAASPARPTSYDTVVFDCIPDGMTFVDYGPLPDGVTTDTDLGPDCASGTRISWLVGPVPTGDVIELTYTAAVDSGADASTTFTNVATVVGSTLDNGKLDRDVEGVYSQSATSQVRTSNGALSKTVAPQKAPVGSTATWTIQADYLGSLVFSDASIGDVLPVGVDPDTVATEEVVCTGDPAGCAALEAEATFGELTQTGRNLSWTIGDVPESSGDVSVTIRYSARVESLSPSMAAGDILTNTATSTYAACVSAGTCPSATSDLVVVRPELRVGKGVETPTPTPGKPFTYTVTVSNDSSPLSSAAYLIDVVDAIPDGVIVDETTISDGGVLSGASDSSGGTITWAIPGPLEAGASLVLTYDAKLPSSATSGTFTNTVDIPTYASYPTNGDIYDDVLPAQATVTTGDPVVDLGIVKTPSGSTTPGSPWTFSMAVSNAGPSDAESPVVVVDTLPVGLAFVASGPDWNCLPYDQTVYCILLDADGDYAGLEAGEDAPPLIITVQTASSPENASYRNEAEVFSSTEDPNPDNNVSSATVTVSPRPLPPNPDPEKPTDPTDPGTTDPDQPLVPQKPTKPVKPPTTIEPERPTVVLPGGITTSAGEDVTVDVRCRPLRTDMSKATLTLSGAIVPMGDASYCRVQRSESGKVSVTVTYPGQVLVILTYSAPGSDGVAPYRKVVRYVVTPA